MQLSEKYKYNKLQIMLWAQLQMLRVVLDYQKNSFPMHQKSKEFSTNGT